MKRRNSNYSASAAIRAADAASSAVQRGDRGLESWRSDLEKWQQHRIVDDENQTTMFDTPLTLDRRRQRDRSQSQFDFAEPRKRPRRRVTYYFCNECGTSNTEAEYRSARLVDSFCKGCGTTEMGHVYRAEKFV